MLDIVLRVAFAVLIFALITPMVLCRYDLKFGTSYSCWFGWHNGKGSAQSYWDGCSLHAKCSKCGKEVMQDSQGNWF